MRATMVLGLSGLLAVVDDAFISFPHLFENPSIATFVGMILDRHGSIRPLHLFIGRVFRYAKDLVGIHCGGPLR